MMIEPEILFEDPFLTVAVKPAGLLSERGNPAQSFAEQLATRNPNGYVGVIHRLDRGVGGVMLYARTPDAAAHLSRQVQEGCLKKEYLAILHGTPDASEGRLCDLLFFDRMRNKSFVVDRKRNGVKDAALSYRVLQSIEHPTYGALSLVRVILETGRTHQIRVQFSSRRHPLLGDGKYGAADHCPIALASFRLCFTHPKTKKPMTVERLPVGEIWEAFSSLSEPIL